MKSVMQILVAAWLVTGCQDEIAEAPANTDLWSNIRSIETTFISHQGDTQDKHNRLVASAQFQPDGTLDGITQHMTYPYTNMEEHDRELWAAPVGELWLHTLDGLTLGVAERNFSYGNDWPKAYAEWLARKGHPRFQYLNSELGAGARSTFEFEGDLPSEITTLREWEHDRPPLIKGLQETFLYDNAKVTLLSEGDIVDEEGLKLYEEYMRELNIPIRPGYERQRKREIHFVYDRDNLTYVKNGNITHKFVYDDQDRLISSEYYLRGDRMTQRIYHYGADNLKSKTEIFNAMEELEYTILYTYKFWPES